MDNINQFEKKYQVQILGSDRDHSLDIQIRRSPLLTSVVHYAKEKSLMEKELSTQNYFNVLSAYVSELYHCLELPADSLSLSQYSLFLNFFRLFCEKSYLEVVGTIEEMYEDLIFDDRP